MNVDFQPDFDRSAAHYDTYASQQRGVLEGLVARVTPYLIEDPVILDGGCATGYLSQYLKQIDLSWDVCGLDISPAMCHMATQRCEAIVCADLESLPIADESLDGVFSSLAMQWVRQPERAVDEAFRCIKPGGIMAFSTYVRGTLSELHRAIMQCDQPVWPFAEEQLHKRLVKKAGFELCEIEVEEQSSLYPSLFSLLKQLKYIGANRFYPVSQSAMNPAQFRQMERYYNAQFSNESGVLASWRIQYIIARKPKDVG